MVRPYSQKDTSSRKVLWMLTAVYMWTMCIALAFHHHDCIRLDTVFQTSISYARQASVVFLHKNTSDSDNGCSSDRCPLCQWTAQGTVFQSINHPFGLSAPLLLGYFIPSSEFTVSSLPTDITSRGPPIF